jgi:hypothetical protein
MGEISASTDKSIIGIGECYDSVALKINLNTQLML